MIRHIVTALLIFELLNPFVTAAQKVKHPGSSRNIHEFLNDKPHHGKGKRWALLVAGSRGYENYRHQANICHAYQILRKGGLRDKNIIVFMYDDIAYNPENPRPGVLINHPHGDDVYKGVPKDYTGNQTTVHNLLNAILGNKRALTGGSGKVLNTGPEDHIFIYYTDHGAAGLVAMPTDESLYAHDLIKVLKKKHKEKGYKSMVIYLEACKSGSLFEGLLEKNLNIYATTSSNAEENSYSTYYSNEFHTFLGDLYSVAWMEDSDKHDSASETLAHQYQVVKERTYLSHVMQYGNLALNKSFLSYYIGVNRASHKNTLRRHYVAPYSVISVNQRDANLHYYKQEVQRSPKGSKRWIEAQEQLQSQIDSRKLVDDRMKQITKILFPDAMLHNSRPAGQPLVDDWDCFKTVVETYEKHCGSFSSYGKKYTRTFANMCNAGIAVTDMIMAAEASCK